MDRLKPSKNAGNNKGYFGPKVLLAASLISFSAWGKSSKGNKVDKIEKSSLSSSKDMLSESLPASPDSTSDSDRIDIKKLEDKYWSAKDDDFTVVQNRRYNKANRFYFSLMGGVPVNDPYSSGSVTGAHFGYFLNERLGVDFEYMRGQFHENDASAQFDQQYGAKPNGNYFDGSQTIGISFFPLYAKMSWLDQSIIYFDMGISAGIGSLFYKIRKLDGDEGRGASSYYLTVTQQIFFSTHFALRADFINRWTNEGRLFYNANDKTALTSANGRDMGNKTYNDTSLMFGLTYWH